MTMFADPFADIQALTEHAAALNMTIRDARQYLDSIAPLADREVERLMTCPMLVPNPDSIFDHECGWTGRAVVGLFFETAEGIWWCGDGHQNEVKIGEVE